MSQCVITQRGSRTGNRVSHSNRKSVRWFQVNIQNKRYFSPTLQRWVRLKVSAKGIRMIDKHGVDFYLKELGYITE
ncbi:MAG: 50S ribosomal protein L28 [Legionellales bacterium]|nr:50S ribosomal protein L28 [Legionellales bacterium]